METYLSALNESRHVIPQRGAKSRVSFSASKKDHPRTLTIPIFHQIHYHQAFFKAPERAILLDASRATVFAPPTRPRFSDSLTSSPAKVEVGCMAVASRRNADARILISKVRELAHEEVTPGGSCWRWLGFLRAVTLE